MAQKQITDQSSLTSFDEGDVVLVRDVSAGIDTIATRDVVTQGVIDAIPAMGLESSKFAEDFVRGQQQVGGTSTSETGFLLQWGKVSTPVLDSNTPKNVTITFPKEFAEAPFLIPSIHHNSGAIDDLTVSLTTLSVTGATLRARAAIIGTAQAASITWLALGKAK